MKFLKEFGKTVGISALLLLAVWTQGSAITATLYWVTR